MEAEDANCEVKSVSFDPALMFGLETFSRDSATSSPFLLPPLRWDAQGNSELSPCQVLIKWAEQPEPQKQEVAASETPEVLVCREDIWEEGRRDDGN